MTHQPFSCVCVLHFIHRAPIDQSADYDLSVRAREMLVCLKAPLARTESSSPLLRSGDGPIGRLPLLINFLGRRHPTLQIVDAAFMVRVGGKEFGLAAFGLFFHAL